jgi:hypothetical protein
MHKQKKILFYFNNNSSAVPVNLLASLTLANYTSVKPKQFVLNLVFTNLYFTFFPHSKSHKIFLSSSRISVYIFFICTYNSANVVLFPEYNKKHSRGPKLTKQSNHFHRAFLRRLQLRSSPINSHLRHPNIEWHVHNRQPLLQGGYFWLTEWLST